MDGGLLCLCGYIAAGGDDDEGVGLAVRVLDVEASEEDGGSRDDRLRELGVSGMTRERVAGT